MEEIITIDETGRVVIPKRVRQRLALRAGRRLRLLDDTSRIVLEPIDEAPAPAETSGILVIKGRLVGPVPDHRTTREEFYQRLITP